MTSPKKTLEIDKESTLFGDLTHIEKQSSRMSQNLIEDLQLIRRLQDEYDALEKDTNTAAQEFQVRARMDIKILEQNIKNYVTSQKGEYSRLSTQVNQIISSHKQLSLQLNALNVRVQEYRKNVGL